LAEELVAAAHFVLIGGGERRSGRAEAAREKTHDGRVVARVRGAPALKRRGLGGGEGVVALG
jgi:hypothetical protein